MLLFVSQDLPLTIIATSAIVFLLTVFYYFRKNRGLLPGPTGVPYLGLYPFLENETCHLQLAEYGKKYGDVFSFTFTGKHFIHLGSVKALRDLHVNKSDCFAERFTNFSILTYMLEDGVTMSNGDMWRAHKKFFIQKFREYGLNSLRDNSEAPIYDSLEKTLRILYDAQVKPINVVHLLTERCSETLRRMIFGENGITDEELQAVNACYGASLEGMTGTHMMIMGPFGRFLLNISPIARKALQAHEKLRKILDVCIERIESSMNKDHPSCIVEEYFKEKNDRRKQNDPIWKTYTDFALVSSVIQFVGDGILGVAAFIGLFLNALIENPDVQEKIYEEIMEVVGPTRQPVLEDKPKLPYTNAFLNEVTRTAVLVPIMPSLECTKETTYRGYKIPKGAITVQNFWAIHHNPETFEDPENFNPSRYIPDSEKPRAELPTTFGMGKRTCSGEVFVMAQTFLFVTTIIKNFRIVSSNSPKDYTATDFVLTGQLELCFQSRNEK